MDTAFLFIQAIQGEHGRLGFICRIKLDNKRENSGLIALYAVSKIFVEETKSKPNIVLGNVNINFNPIELPVTLELSIIGNNLERLLLKILTASYYMLLRYSYSMKKPSMSIFGEMN